MSTRFHPLAWVLWFVAVLLPATLTRNPLYLSVLLAALALDLWWLNGRSLNPRGWGHFLYLALWLVLLTPLFNVLTVHYGEHVWAELPRSWPVVGGPLTLEALLFGLSGGLSLLTLLVAFATFNLEMPASRWVRLVPPALFQAGLITSIAVTFVPATVSAAREIYDAQRLRGHRFRRLTDYTPLFAPLVVDSLERSVQLAQSMTARGFGANLKPLPASRRLLFQVGTLGALLLMLVGLFLPILSPRARALSTPLVLASVFALVLIFILQGRRVCRTFYRRWYWRRRDTLLALGSALLIGVTLLTRLMSPRTWLYYPYPPYSIVPTFALVPGVFLLLAALPALLAPSLSQPADAMHVKARP